MAEIHIGTTSPYYTQWCKDKFTIPLNSKNIIQDIPVQYDGILGVYSKAEVEVKDSNVEDLITTFDDIQDKLPAVSAFTQYNTLDQLVGSVDAYVSCKNAEVA